MASGASSGNSGVISSLEIQISASTGDAEQKINKLSAALKNLKQQVNVPLGQSMQAFLNSLKNINLIGANKLTKLLSDISKLGKISIGTSLPKQIEGLTTAVDGITDDSFQRIERLTNALGKLSGVDFKGFNNFIQNGGNGGGNSIGKRNTGAEQSIFKDIADAGNKAWNAVKTVFNSMKKAANSVKKVITGIGSAFKKSFDKTFLGQISKQINTFMNSIGRIAFYRAIRSAIKYVTDALKEGTENAYWYSKELGDSTRYISEAYDRLSSSNFKMSNQLGAAWTTLIATIEPIIQRIIALISRAAEIMTMFFSILGGKSTYLKAIDYTKDWADATAGGAKAAKEWKNQLLAFDEINRLEEPSDSSGGGGASAPDYGSMFEEANLGDYFKDIRDAIENGQWAELGQMLAKKVNNIFNPENFDFEDAGEKIGKKINNVLTFAFNFVKKTDFKQIGADLTGVINGAMREIDFTQAGRLAASKITVIGDLIIGAVLNLDMIELAHNFQDFVMGALTELEEWIDAQEPTEIGQKFKDFFGEVDWKLIGEELLVVLRKAWNFAIDILGESVPRWARPVFVRSGEDTGAAYISSLENELASSASDVEKSLDTGTVKPVDSNQVKFLKKIGIIKTGYAAEMDDIIALSSDMSTNVTGDTDTTGNSWDELKTKSSSAWTNIKSSIVTAWALIKSTSVTSGNAVVKSISTGWETLKTKATSIWDNIKAKITGSNKEIETDATSKSDAVKTSVSTKYEGLNTSLVTTVSNMKSTISARFASIKQDSETKMETMKNNIVAKFSSMASQIKNNINSIKSAMNFSWSLPRPRIPQISYWLNTVYYGNGNSVSLPQFYVNWYAKGGIFDKASLIGVGENGKEAVMPLERNTEWIGTLASQIQSHGGVDGNDTASAVEESGDEIVNAILSATVQIISAMRENNSDDNGRDFEGFVRQVTKVQRRQARAAGAV